MLVARADSDNYQVTMEVFDNEEGTYRLVLSMPYDNVSTNDMRTRITIKGIALVPDICQVAQDMLIQLDEVHVAEIIVRPDA
jgi:hypothetical protein